MTNETAEQLREEIALTISNSEPFNSEYFDDFDYKLIGSIAEKSINKVLDAVEKEIYREIERYGVHTPPIGDYESGNIQGMHKARYAINKLRP